MKFLSVKCQYWMASLVILSATSSVLPSFSDFTTYWKVIKNKIFQMAGTKFGRLILIGTLRIYVGAGEDEAK